MIIEIWYGIKALGFLYISSPFVFPCIILPSWKSQKILSALENDFSSA